MNNQWVKLKLVRYLGVLPNGLGSGLHLKHEHPPGIYNVKIFHMSIQLWYFIIKLNKLYSPHIYDARNLFS